MRTVTVAEGMRAVVRVDGRTAATLGPGRHRLPRRSPADRLARRGVPAVTQVDVRRRVLLVAGQELATADVPGVRVTAAVSWEVGDPAALLSVAVDPVDELRVAVQLALRRAAAARSLEELTAARAELSAELAAAVAAGAAATGITVLAAELRDVSPPGEVRRAQLALLTARQEGLAALERARGESAALRALANGARALADPALLQLRTAQVVADAGGELVLHVGAAGRAVATPDGGGAEHAGAA